MRVIQNFVKKHNKLFFIKTSFHQNINPFASSNLFPSSIFLECGQYFWPQKFEKSQNIFELAYGIGIRLNKNVKNTDVSVLGMSLGNIHRWRQTFFGHFWPTYHIRRFLPYNVQCLGAFLDQNNLCKQHVLDMFCSCNFLVLNL